MSQTFRLIQKNFKKLNFIFFKSKPGKINIYPAFSYSNIHISLRKESIEFDYLTSCLNTDLNHDSFCVLKNSRILFPNIEFNCLIIVLEL
jgi:hypothetical protein